MRSSQLVASYSEGGGWQREHETHSGDEQDVDRRGMQGEAVRAEEGQRSLVAKDESTLLSSRYERMGRTVTRIAMTTGQRMWRSSGTALRSGIVSRGMAS